MYVMAKKPHVIVRNLSTSSNLVKAGYHGCCRLKYRSANRLDRIPTSGLPHTS